MKGNEPPDNLPRSSRRRILRLSAGTLTTGLAGCLGGDGSSGPPTQVTSTPKETATSSSSAPTARHEQVDPFTEVARNETRSMTTLSFEVPLEAGQFAHRELRIAEPSEVYIKGESTADIDVFLLAGEHAFSKYQAGESAIFSGGFTATGINSIDRTVEIGPGAYFLVFDNTPVYGAEPQGEVSSQFEIVVSSGPSDPTETETQTETEPPSQPKIREVTDNMGHTFTFSDADYAGSPVSSVRVDDEVEVSDGMDIELCVTEVAKRTNDEVTYSFRFGNSRSEHPDNPEATRIEDNCWSWEMQRSDYQSDWGFRIWVRNQDEIYYQNSSVESDYRVDVYYTNLTLDE